MENQYKKLTTKLLQEVYLFAFLLQAGAFVNPSPPNPLLPPFADDPVSLPGQHLHLLGGCFCLIHRTLAEVVLILQLILQFSKMGPPLCSQIELLRKTEL